MKARHVAIGLGSALPAAVLSGFTVYLMGAPEWAPWLTLFVSYAVYAIGFLIVVEALTEAAPYGEAVERPAVLDSPAVERLTFSPKPHHEAKPPELFAGLINAEDATAVFDRNYQGKRRMGAQR